MEGKRGITPPPRQKQGSISRKQQNPSCPNENKANYGDTKNKNQGRKFYNKSQVRQVSFKEGDYQVRHVSFKEGDRKDQNKPVKMLDESIAKRKSLVFTGSGIICFLCRSTWHVAPHCKAYPNTKPTIAPCKCGLFHPENVFKNRGNIPQQPGRVVRN